MFTTNAANIAAQRQASMFDDQPVATGHDDLFAVRYPEPGTDRAPQVFALLFDDGALATIPAALDRIAAGLTLRLTGADSDVAQFCADLQPHINARRAAL